MELLQVSIIAVELTFAAVMPCMKVVLLAAALSVPPLKLNVPVPVEDEAMICGTVSTPPARS